MGPAQQADGEEAVRRQHQQQGQSRPGGGVQGDGVQQGLHLPEGEGRQRTPYHRKGHADPAVQVHVGAGIVPEHDPQQPVIEKMHGIFHGGGREAAVKGQAEEAPGQVGGQVQHRQHGQTVHRAQGQQEKALAHLMPGPGDSGEDFFQQISQKAIQTKQPQPVHGDASLPPHSAPGGLPRYPGKGGEREERYGPVGAAAAAVHELPGLRPGGYPDQRGVRGGVPHGGGAAGGRGPRGQRGPAG